MLSKCTVLNSYVKVSSLECGALYHGGATQVGDFIYSNISTGDPIETFPCNLYGLMIPTTVNIDEEIDPQEYIDRYTSRLELVASGIGQQKARGSWYSEELGRVIVEDVTILTFTSDYDWELIVKFLILTAEKIKEEMNQEAVSIMVNSGLIIA